MLAEKVLAGKSKIEDYFPEYAHYTVPEDGKIFHHLRGLASWDSPFHCSVSYTHTCTFTNTHMLLFSVCEVRQLLHPVLPVLLCADQWVPRTWHMAQCCLRLRRLWVLGGLAETWPTSSFAHQQQLRL